VIALRVTGPDADLVPGDGTDLTVRAAALLRERYGSPELGARIQLTKSIPVAAGLAGGSADAAGALLACSVLWDLDTDPAVLSHLGAKLGADVPFALLGGTALGTGRGTELMPLLTRGRYYWALAYSAVGLSTPQVFAQFDQNAPAALPQLPDGLLRSLASGDVTAVGQCLVNDLQAPALVMRGELGQTLRYGAGLDGVVGAVLSGSGPTCAFLCTDARAAKATADRLSRLPTVRTAQVAVGAACGAQLLS
jgi:4-diphosphocytidyl-2-C-methyl-D-erythritol kinase